MITRSIRKAVFWALASLVVQPVGLLAQAPDDASPDADSTQAAAPHPGDIFTVALLTIGQGDQLWDSFGHNALVLQNLSTGQAVAYDWGRFSFAQEGFWTNLLMGRMQYSMGWAPPEALYQHYQGLNRTITLQELNLSGEAKIALVQEITRIQADPEYRYEYFLDNCSTRVRDFIDRASGGALGQQSALPEEDYRFHTRRLTQHSVPLWAGFDVLLGNRGDVQISRLESLFTPLELVEQVREVSVTIDGQTMPLVADEQVLFQSTRPAEPEEPRSMLLTFLGMGLVLGGWLAWSGSLSGRGKPPIRVGFGLTAGVWCLIAGILGLVLLFVLVTNHVWMHWNENALQFTPLSLVLIPLVMAAAWRGSASRRAVFIAGAAAALSVAGFVLQVFPWFDQGNGALIALAMPVHLGLFWALRQLAPAEA